jgi:hypothetical protein
MSKRRGCGKCLIRIAPQYEIIQIQDGSYHFHKKICPRCERYVPWLASAEANRKVLLSAINLDKLPEKELDFINFVAWYLCEGMDLPIDRSKRRDDILTKYRK